jgi:hypothetical protein
VWRVDNVRQSAFSRIASTTQLLVGLLWVLLPTGDSEDQANPLLIANAVAADREDTPSFVKIFDT